LNLEQDFKAKVILASASKDDPRLPPLITVQLRYPRFIHSELMTHRVFSRNARSSRAVPVKTLINEEAYLPHFLMNQPGMQAFEEFTPEELAEIEQGWLDFAEKTRDFVRWLNEKKVHKQWANRPLEWFGYIDTLVTATDWDNWFGLRDHPDAAPEIQFLAKQMKKEFERVFSGEKTGELQWLGEGQWHFPYILATEKILGLQDQLELSVARCARVSYSPFDGNASVEKERERYLKLKNANPLHASPFEHQAKHVGKQHSIFDEDEYVRSNLAFPWLQYRKLIEKNI